MIFYLFSRMIAILIAMSLFITVDAPARRVAVAKPPSQTGAMTEMAKTSNPCKVCQKNAARHSSCLLFSSLIFVAEYQNTVMEPKPQTSFFLVPTLRLDEFRA